MRDSRAIIAIAGEDEAHRILATRLVDAVVLERAAGSWPSAEELGHCRLWCGWRGAAETSPNEGFYRFQTLDRDLDERLGRRLFRTPRIGDEPAGKALWFIKLYQLFALRKPRPHILIGVRDTGDGDLEMEAERARRYMREELRSEMSVVFALPFRDAEAWFVAGLVDVDVRREAAKRELSFDPIAEPHRLTAQPNTASTDAKRVLRFLLGEGSTLRETRSSALSASELDLLADRTLTDLRRLEPAAVTGLARFLKVLRDEVAPRVLP